MALDTRDTRRGDVDSTTEIPRHFVQGINGGTQPVSGYPYMDAPAGSTSAPMSVSFSIVDILDDWRGVAGRRSFRATVDYPEEGIRIEAISPIAEPQPSTEEIFRQLLDRWRRETGHLATIEQKIWNRTYLEIIGLGRPALRPLLRELQERPSFLFWALSAIAREDPVPAGATLDQAVGAWLDWGRRRGLID
jgi:hypothetical protein